MVSILIINWNGTRFIFNCLDTILAHVTVPYEVIVVDNHSTDGSPDVLTERYPWVKLIRSDDNLGFVGGNNLAATYATGKYLLLLNYDTLLQTDIADAIKALEADDRIGAVGALMYDGEGKLQPSSGHFPTPARLWIFASQWDNSSNPWPSPAGVPLQRRDRVDGSLLITRADSWKKIGGLDPAIYMYGEDLSYCRSLLEIGQVSVLFLSLIQIVQLNTYNLEGRQRQFLAGAILAVAVAFLTAWIGSRILGTLAAVAWSQVVTAMLWWLGNEYVLRKRTGLRIKDALRVLAGFAFALIMLEGNQGFGANLVFAGTASCLCSVLFCLILFPEERIAIWHRTHTWVGASR